MESYFKPGGGMASYSFTADNKVVFNKFDKPFDVVIMNDCSQCPIHPQLKDVFHEFARKHSQTAVKNGAKPMLFMTWAYADAAGDDRAARRAVHHRRQRQRGAGDSGGPGIREVDRRDPKINLYDPDKRHPSLAGSYLAAATIYASLYGKSPAGLPTRADSRRRRRYLQEVAWDTVREYFGK